MARIIPGVDITVVKDVVPKQLAPAGILGIVGYTAVEPQAAVVRAASWNTVVEQLGAGTALSMPEVPQALANGVAELVIVPLPHTGSASSSYAVQASGATLFTLTASTPGSWSDGLAVSVARRTTSDGVIGLDLAIQDPRSDDPVRVINASLDPTSNRFLPRAIAGLPGVPVVQAVDSYELSGFDGSGTVDIDVTPDNTAAVVVGGGQTILELTRSSDATTSLRLRLEPVDLDGVDHVRLRLIEDPAGAATELAVSPELPTGVGMAAIGDWLAGALGGVDHSDLAPGATLPWPEEQVGTLSGGSDAAATAYIAGLDQLDDHPDVDLVCCAVQDYSDVDDLVQIYSSIIAHCQRLADDAKGRIGFGEVAPLSGSVTKAKQLEMVDSLVSDRFVLVVPHGLQGAVAGRIGSLTFFQSPTFKTVAGVAPLHRDLGLEDQRAYLKKNFLPVVTERGRGTIMVRGLTTDGDQINVRRTADRAVRQVKAIGDLFIGRLNNEEGRIALKQNLVAAFTQMEQDGAIVPSTDGSSPAFTVAVSSSQRDFALGIVRVDIAVRPVRAIDYIYATIQVQV